MNASIKSLLVAVVASASLFNATAQDIKTGMYQLDGELYSKAKATFQGLATTTPSADNQFYLGYYFLRTKDAKNAKDAFEKGLALDPKNPINYLGLGGVELLHKNLGGAKAHINKGLEISKYKDANILYRAAEMYVLFKDKDETNDPAEAIRLIDLIQNVKKATPQPEYSMVKGDAYFIKNDGGPAVTEYERALMLDPKLARAYVMAGEVFKRGRNFKEAPARFQKAIEADSNFAPTYWRFGELWLFAHNYKNAAFNYKKYLEKCEPLAQNKLKYVKLAFLSKDYDNAERVLKEIAGQINDPDILRMEGYMNIERGNPTIGIEKLTQLLNTIKKEEQFASDYSMMARGYAKLSKYDDAIKHYEIAAPMDTTENHFANIYTIQYTNQKNYKEAAKTYLKAIALKNQRKEKVTVNDYNTLGRTYYFASGVARTEKDTLTQVALASKADSAFNQVIEQTVTSGKPFLPAFLMKARTQIMLDADKTKWLAVPHYEKYLEMAMPEKDKNKKDMVEAYRYLAGYSIVMLKDEIKANDYLNKAVELAPDDATLKELLNRNAPPAPPAPPAPKK